jgi:cysteine-rich repeat protein
MKRWVVLIVLVALLGFSYVYLSDNMVQAQNLGPERCEDVVCPAGNDQGCDEEGDICGDGGLCVWHNVDSECCPAILICDEGWICCQGPGCDPYCDYPGCDPFDECETCGNGWIDSPEEECDDGNRQGGDGCNAYCAVEGCGNGIIEEYLGEECDDGNMESGDGCSYPACQLEGGPWCGNGEECVIDADCDDDNTDEVCLNGFCVEVDAGEECEDGNLEGGDGCFNCEIDGSYQCDDSQRIMKIASLSNAHGELWNGSGGYVIEICYDEIFGATYNGPNPHECTETNTVLRLADGPSSETNAHAERREGAIPEYDLEVCYGDLICVSRPANEDCNEGAGEREVVSLAAGTNAHLETNDSNQYASAGEYKVCCSGSTEPEIYDVRWERPLGVEINETFVNKSSFLVAYTVGLNPGTTVTFDIDEADCLSGFNYPCVGDDDITIVSGLTDGSGKAKSNLEFNDSIMNAGSGGEATPELEFYFTASADTVEDRVSDLLIVYPFEVFEPPVAVISSPNHRGIYFNGTNLTFDGTDSEHAEEFLWTVVYQGEEEFTDNRSLFNHSFVDPGMRTVTLRVTNEDGVDEAQIAIVVAASPYMLAYINKPGHREILSNSDEERVDYSSSDSYVTNTEPQPGLPCDINVSCAAGYCPSITENIPDGCNDVDNLTVWGAPSGPEDADYMELFFDWSFSDEHQTISFSGYDNETGWVLYDHESNALDDKTGELSLHFNISDTEEISESVDRVFTLGQCLSDGTEYIFLNGTLLSTEIPGVCAGQDGLIGGEYPDCCPAGRYCTDEGGPAVCAFSEIGQCRDYPDDTSCESDCEPGFPCVAEIDPAGFDLQCMEDFHREGIECYWEDQGDGDDTNDECGIRLICEPNQGENGQCIDYLCEYTYPAAECVDGLMTIEYILQEFGGVPDNACDGYPQDQSEYEALCGKDPVTVPCGRLNFELSFFDYKQFFAAALVILLIYLVLHNTQGKRRKE